MDITLSDYDGRTALHLAACEGHLECVQFLLEQCGVPSNPKDRWGNLPIDEAETFGHENVVTYLKSLEEKKPFDNSTLLGLDTLESELQEKNVSSSSSR